MMNGETGFCIASGSGRSLSVGLLRIRGELAIGALFATDFTGGQLVSSEHWIASRNLLPPHMGSPRQPSLVLFPLYINNLPMWAGPCGVVGDALASSKRSGKSTGFCWPPTLPLARQCVLAALHGDECMDKLKRRCGQSEGSSPLGASSRRKWVHR